MTNFRFLHAADLHLDSKLDSLDEQAAAHVLLASRRSVERIVATAIDQQVAAVVIAGDLFDGPVRDVSGALWIDTQFRKLTSSGIPVILIRGNHDALSQASKSVRWSPGVIELKAEQAQTHIIEQHGIAVHGQSFGARAVSENIAAQYPQAIDGYFNIGLLHTSLGGALGHDTYAPTTIDVLEGRGYDYWALGHIHMRSTASLSTRAWIGYSGNTQGRHIRECGPRGCNLVHVENGRVHRVDFIETDSVRWLELPVDLQGMDMLSDLTEFVSGACEHLRGTHPDRHLAVRVRLSGPSKLHSHLAGQVARQHITSIIQERMHSIGSMWLEKVKFETVPEQRATTRADMQLPLGTMRKIVEEIHEQPAIQKEMMKVLAELERRAAPVLRNTEWQLWREANDSKELLRLVTQAEQLLEAWVGEDEAS